VPGSSRRDVNAMRVIASALGVCAGVSGLEHGFFEILQGNAQTPGLFVQSIGPAQRIWVYGTEDAFTLVSTFLASGLLSVAIGAPIIAWSILFVDAKNGPGVCLLLGWLLFLVGGGVAQIGFVVLCWAILRRIGRPLAWPRKLLPADIRGTLSRLWPGALVASLALSAFALEIAIFGFVPGVTDPDRARLVCWSALGVMLPVLLAGVVGGSERDSERAAEASQPPGG